MRINILKRLEAVERAAKRGGEQPSLIMIHYDSESEKWSVTEHYSAENRKKPANHRTKTSAFDHLKDFFFPAEFQGRVILDTFGNPDPVICENLFCWHIEELRVGQQGEIAIQSIVDPPDERALTVTVCTSIKS